MESMPSDAEIEAGLLQVARRRAERERTRLLGQFSERVLGIAVLVPNLTPALGELLGEDLSQLETLPRSEREPASASAGVPDPEWLRGVRTTLTRTRDDCSKLVGLATELGQKLSRAQDRELPLALTMWATLAREGAELAGMRLSDITAATLNRASDEADLRARELWHWLESARPLAELYQRVAQPSLTTAMQNVARAIELLDRKARDERILKDYLPRPVQDRAYTRLLEEPDFGRWALHYSGAGGIGKTMLIRHLQAHLSDSRAITARIDFDFLSPTYPSMAPGLLYLAFIDELRPLVRTEAQSYFQRVTDLVTKLHAKPPAPGIDPLRDSLFVDATRAFGEALRVVGTERKIVLILDTCEELSRNRGADRKPSALLDTFRIVEALKFGADTLNGAPPGSGLGPLRVVFAGRRLIASAGANYDATEGSARQLPARPYLFLHEIVGFSEREAHKLLGQTPSEEYRKEVLNASADVAERLHVRWTEPVREDEARRFLPYDLAWFAKRLTEPDPPSITEVRAAQGDGYVSIRILRRLAHPKLEAALPVLVRLRAFDRQLIAAGWGSDQADELLEGAIYQEWIHDHQAPSGETVYTVDARLLERLVEHYRETPIAPKQQALLVDHLERRALTGSSLLDVTLLSALLRLVGHDRQKLDSFWSRFERRLLVEWSSTVSAELLAQLLERESWLTAKSSGERNVCGRLIATEALAIPWSQTARFEARLTYMKRSKQSRAIASEPSNAARLQVAATRHALFAIVRGLDWSAGSALSESSADQTAPADEVGSWCAILASWYALQTAEWAVAAGEDLGGVLDKSGLLRRRQHLREIGTAAPTGVAHWAKMLRARAELLVGNDGDARALALEALEQLERSEEFTVPLGALRGLKGRAVAALELAAWGYQSGALQFEDIQRTIRAAGTGNGLEFDRLASCLIELELSREVKLEKPQINKETLRLASAELPTEVSLWKVPEPVAVMDLLAASGRVAEALTVVDDLNKLELPDIVRHRCQSTHADIVLAFRLSDANVEVAAALRESTGPFDRALVATSEVFGRLPSGLPSLSRDSNPRHRVIELHGLYQSTVVTKPTDRAEIEKWLASEVVAIGQVFPWDNLPELYRWTIAVDSAEISGQALPLASETAIRSRLEQCSVDRHLVVPLGLRYYALGADLLEALSAACDRFGHRWMATLALKEGCLLALRLPDHARALLQAAARWFARSRDDFGELRALTAEILMCPGEVPPTGARLQLVYDLARTSLELPSFQSLIEAGPDAIERSQRTTVSPMLLPWLRRIAFAHQLLCGGGSDPSRWFPTGSTEADLPTDVALAVLRRQRTHDEAHPPSKHHVTSQRHRDKPLLVIEDVAVSNVRNISAGRHVTLSWSETTTPTQVSANLDDRSPYAELAFPHEVSAWLKAHKDAVVELQVHRDARSVAWEAMCGRGGPALRRVPRAMYITMSPEPVRSVTGYAARSVGDFVANAWQGYFSEVHPRVEPELTAGIVHLVGDVREDGSSSDSLRLYFESVFGEKGQAESTTLAELRRQQCSLFILQATPRPSDPTSRTVTHRYEAGLARTFADAVAGTGVAVLVLPALELRKALHLMELLPKLLVEDPPKDADDLARRTTPLADVIRDFGAVYEESAADVCLYAPPGWTSPFAHG